MKFVTWFDLSEGGRIRFADSKLPTVYVGRNFFWFRSTTAIQFSRAFPLKGLGFRVLANSPPATTLCATNPLSLRFPSEDYILHITMHLWLLRISELRTLADLGYSPSLTILTIKGIHPARVEGLESWWRVLPRAGNQVLVMKLVCYAYVHHRCALAVLHDVIKCVSLRIPHLEFIASASSGSICRWIDLS